MKKAHDDKFRNNHYLPIIISLKSDKLKLEQLEQLDEAAALQDISHMPARVKCAMLGWRTMKEMFGLKN